MIQHLAMVAIGGALGASLRYGTNLAMLAWLGKNFPWGTLTVNLLGSLIIGLAWALFAKDVPDQSKHLLFIGFLGAFTTFSTFSLDIHQLIQNNQLKLALLYFTVSNIGGIALCFAGFALGRQFAQLSGQ